MPKETEQGNLVAASHGLQAELEKIELPWLKLHQEGLQQTWMAFDRLKHQLVLKNGVWR